MSLWCPNSNPLSNVMVCAGDRAVRAPRVCDNVRVEGLYFPNDPEA